MIKTIASILIVPFLFFGCSGSGNKPVSTSNRVIEWELSDADALNPFNSTSADATYLEEQIYQRLITIDPTTMKYTVPILATAMPVESPDHLQYDFTLRNDIKWPDGKPFTGEDVIFSLKALKNPFNISAGQKRVYVDPIHSVELIDGDPYRVRFKLWKPYFLIMQASFGDVLYMMPKHLLDPQGLTDHYSWDDIASIVETTGNKEIDSAALAKHKNDASPAMHAMADQATWFTDASRNREPKYIQGTGPYKLDEWLTNQYTRFVRNPNYVNHWGTFGEANPDTMIYKTINDFNAATTALKSHDVDLLGALQAQYWAGIDTNHSELKRIAFPLGQFTYIGFSEKSPIFRDPGVRWAMAYMVDRKTIIEKLLYGTAKLTQSVVTSTHPEANHDLPIISYDPAKAAHILASLADSIKWLMTVPKEFDRRERMTFAMTLKSDGTFIGSSGFHDISSEHHRLMMGYVLNRKYWDKGYMTEAVREMIRFAFEEMSMHRVAANCDLENVRSARVMERCGMKLEGTLRDYEIRHGTFVSTKTYAIINGN